MTAGSHDAPVLRALDTLPGDELLAYLKAQRWFGAKSGAPSVARVRDAVVLPWGDGKYAMARVVVDANGAHQMYQLPFSAHDGVDAIKSDDFRQGLIAALTRGARATTDAVQWIAEPIGSVHLPETTKLGSAEQSNTSIIVGDHGILKLFRLLRPGIHPDVEVTSFLTRSGFEHTPKLLGTIRFEKNGEVIVAGMLQTFLAGSSDAWTYTLEKARGYFVAPIDTDPTNSFIEDARRLGVVTRELHEALGGNGHESNDPAFEPEAIVPEDLDRWCHRTQQSIRDSLVLLERQLSTNDFPADRRAEAQALVKRKDHYLAWIDEINDYLDDDVGMRIRVHGDYHLGQVLRTVSNDFMIIDFEGEPSRPLEERREKSSPLRDVAGMLRSFAYAAATLGMQAGTAIDVRTRELRMARWERDVRLAFLEGYLSAPDDEASTILPDDQSHITQLIALFEAEKAFYELAYELNNRPSWVWIPMRGISKLLTASADGMRL